MHSFTMTTTSDLCMVTKSSIRVSKREKCRVWPEREAKRAGVIYQGRGRRREGREEEEEEG